MLLSFWYIIYSYNYKPISIGTKNIDEQNFCLLKIHVYFSLFVRSLKNTIHFHLYFADVIVAKRNIKDSSGKDFRAYSIKLLDSEHLLKQAFPLSHRKALRYRSAQLRINNLITSSYPKHNARKIVISFTCIYVRIKIK